MKVRINIYDGYAVKSKDRFEWAVWNGLIENKTYSIQLGSLPADSLFYTSLLVGWITGFKFIISMLRSTWDTLIVNKDQARQVQAYKSRLGYDFKSKLGIRNLIKFSPKCFEKC